MFSQELADLRTADGELNPIVFTPEVPAVGDSVDILVFFENGGRDSLYRI